ncbi:transcription repressor OFP13-like [Juglans microcarpa x Juglans regia]|uniref:transcription repressor OFP13-like n=1 Tax=Juglans microcarpa x Juglans regia TaxID=2249226 RepID=UPI001B7E2139|nr:transcription repressor OFP13-like [Juglans microcarpa x Juglans regia]
MGKKMKLPFLYKNTHETRSTWPWPSCNQPRTLSFRTSNVDVYNTMNSIYLDTRIDVLETTESSESASFSTMGEDGAGIDPIETMIRGLRSERLFFKPGETSSILEEANKGLFPFKDSVIVSMESRHPYVDFRKSMEEMVEAQGVKEWEGFEELLCWYLRANGKNNHGYIVGAFVDLLVGLAFASSSSCSCSHSPPSPFSSLSSSSTHCISSTEAEEYSDTAPCLSSSLEGQKGIIKKW